VLDGAGRIKRMIKTLIHIKDAIRTTLTGMRITGKYFRPGTEVTHLYPEEPPVVFERTRGRMDVVQEKCIGCMLCARACPVECITIETEKKLAGKGKRASRFEINFSRCMFCGLCVEACPTQAIVHTGKCDFSCYDREELIVDFGMGFYNSSDGSEVRDQESLEVVNRGS
jgi:NADH-quinone oxidoreductase subunit I